LLDIEYDRKVLTEVLMRARALLKTRKVVYLDVGSGMCTTTQFVVNALRPERVICADIDESFLERCREKGFEIVKVDLNAETLPLESGTVDLVTAFEVVEHLWDKDNMLKEVYRVLKQGGLLILSTPNLAAWANRLLLLVGKTPFYYDVSPKRPLSKYGYGHVNLYTLELLRKHLFSHGFEVIEVCGLLTPLYKRCILFEVATLFMAKVRPPLAPLLLVLARKCGNERGE
jgi:ubiquinone/menaquinone biosynthesis C-methylase UbiE